MRGEGRLRMVGAPQQHLRRVFSFFYPCCFFQRYGGGGSGDDDDNLRADWERVGRHAALRRRQY
jgi:hypothetical protein